MIEQLFEFIVNHWILCSAFLILLSVFLQYEMSRGGKGVHCQEAVNLIIWICTGWGCQKSLKKFLN